jgi:D-alanyl-D-alanine carboxypeptidase
MMKKLFILTVLFVSATLFACKKDQVPDPNRELVNRLKTITDSIIQNTTVPGIVALVVDYKRGIDWMYTTGVSDKETKAPMDSNYTFRIASSTKTFTGTVLLQLVDEGKLSLNDQLSKFFPEYPKSDSITVAMLCNMTSGVFDYFSDPQFISSYASDPYKVFPPHELTAIAFENPFTNRPGSQ